MHVLGSCPNHSVKLHELLASIDEEAKFHFSIAHQCIQREVFFLRAVCSA